MHAWLTDSGAKDGGLVPVLAALVMLAVVLRSGLHMASRRFGPGKSSDTSPPSRA